MTKKKIIRNALIGVPAVAVLLVVAALVILHTQSFHRYLLAKVLQSAEQSTGTQITVQKLDLRWSPFTADFYGVVVHGQERNGEPPLLQAEHLGMTLGLRALLNKQVDLYAITLDRPVIWLRVDARGNTNLPKSPPSTSTSNETVLVRHASLRDGTVNYNDQQIPLSAELDDFQAGMQFDAAAQTYRGTLGYRRGRVVTSGLNPVEHNALIEFAANRDHALLDPIVVSAGKTQLTAHLDVGDFANPVVDGKYEAFLVTHEIGEILKNPSLPRGDINLNGTIKYQSAKKDHFLKSVQLAGRIDSRALAVRANPVATSLQSIHGTYRLEDGNLRIQKLNADVLGGHLSAEMEMLHLDQNPVTHVSAALRGAALDRLSDAVPADSRQNVRLLGRLNLAAQANWAKDISALRAHAHLDITGPTTLPAQPNQIPVNGIVNVDYDGARQSAAFEQSSLRVANTQVTLSGVLSRQSSLNVEADAKDLHELTLLSAAFSPATTANAENSGAASYDLRGAVHFAGRITGPTTDPHINGQLSGSNLQVQGSQWRTLRVALDAGSSGVRLQNGYLESAGNGNISFSGAAGLQKWSLVPENPLSLQARVTKLSVADLERLAKADYPITGDLSGEITLAGSQLQPVGHGTLQLSNASAWNEPLRALKLDFQGDKESLHSTAHLQIAAGAADANLTYSPKTEHYEMTLTAEGLKLDQLQSVQRAGSLSGVLTAKVSGQGTLKEPQLTASLQIPQLQVSGQQFSGVNAQMDMAHQRASFSLESVVEQGYVHAKGDVDLTGQYQTDATVDVRALPIGPLLAKYSTATGAAQDLQGFTEIHATLKGPLKDPSRLEGHLEIPRLNLAYKNIQLANERPLRVRYQNGVATVEEAHIKGTGTDLNIQGVVPVQSTVPLNVSAKGGLDVQLLHLLSPDVHAAGKIEIDLHAGGALAQPKTRGSIRIVDTQLAVEDAPISLSAMNGQLSIDGNRLQIDKLVGRAGGGTISANGSATYGKETNFAIDLHAKGVRIRPTGIRSTLDGDLQVNGSPQKSQLSGRIVVDRLSFQEGFDLGTFLSQLSDDSTVSAPSPFASNMNLSIAVNSAQSLDLASSQVSIAGSANLNVTGTAANPVILGRVALTSGELFFQGKRFEIQSGTIAFANPAKTEPVLNLYVKTVVEQYNITINFSGPLDRLKTNYTSDPSLPPLDIINLLAFGQTTAEKASNASTPASLGAESALAQGVAGQVAKGVQNLTGISQLTIDPTAGNNQNPGAQVAIQQRVSGSVLLTFSTDVTSTQRQTVQLQYQPKRQVKISVLRDEYGGYGIDVRLHKVF